MVQLIFGAFIWGDKREKRRANATERGPMFIPDDTDEKVSTMNGTGEQGKAMARDKFLWRLYKGFVGITFGVGIFIFLVARVYLLIESFIALREIPVDSYDSIPWVEAWPHMG